MKEKENKTNKLCLSSISCIDIGEGCLGRAPGRFVEGEGGIILRIGSCLA